jgi:tetratricopeptide (TPR) repeat protein
MCSKKLLLFFGFYLLLSGWATANNDSINYYLQINDLLNAKRLADKQVQQLRADAYTWYLRGEVYAALSKDREQKIITTEDAFIESCNCFIKTVTTARKTGKVSSTYMNKLSRCHLDMNTNGNKYFKQQDFDKAYQFYQKSLDITTLTNQVNKKIEFDTVTIFSQALALEKIGNTEAAKENYLKLLSLKYKNPSLYSNLAYLFKSKEQYGNAIKTIEAGLKISPFDKSLLTDWVNFHIITGKQNAIVNELKQKVQQQKNNADIHFILASLYDNISFTLDAENYYKKTLAIDSSYNAAAYNLAVMYYNLAMDKNKQLNVLDRKSNEFKQIIAERNTLLKKAEPYFKRAEKINPKETDRIIKNIRSMVG